MRKFSLKPFLYSVFFLLTAAALSTCLYEPISYKDFTGDERVTAIVEGVSGRDTEMVVICSDSDEYDDLTPGDARISGLNTDKYYIIEEWAKENGARDTFDTQENVQFVKPDGTRSSNLTSIGKVSDGIVRGLTNNLGYMLSYAKPLTGDVTWYDQTAVPSPAATGRSKTIDENGVLNLDAPERGLYLNLSPATYSANSAPYTIDSIVKIPVSTADSTDSTADRQRPTSVTPSPGSIIKLEGKNTVTEYVIYAKLVIDERIFYNFYTLKVSIGDAPPLPELVITVDYVHPTDQTFTFTPSSLSFNHSQAIAAGGITTINVTVNNASTFNIIKGWYYNDTLVTSGNALTSTLINTFNTNNPAKAVDFTVRGEYKFTFIGIKGTGSDAVPYSGTFTIVIQ